MAQQKETLVSVFDKMRQQYGSKESYISYDANMKRLSITYQELWTLAARYAYILKNKYGLQRNEYVVITTHLSLESTVAAFGIILAGGCVIPMEKLFTDCITVRATLELAKQRLFIIADDDNDIWDFFKENASNISRDNLSADYNDERYAVRQILFTPKPRGLWKHGFLDYLRQSKEEFVDRGLTPENGVITAASANPEVGVPKLVEHSHRSFISMARHWKKNLAFGKSLYVYNIFLPPMFPSDVLFGETRVITDFFEEPVTNFIEHIVDVTKRENVTSIMLTPLDILALADELKPEEKPFFKHIATGGMPMMNAFFEKASTVADTVHICYMSSEPFLIAHNKREHGSGFTALDNGPPIEGVQVRLVNEKNEDVGPGETGLICVKTDALFMRYVGEPEKTEASWMKDGWFNTQDAGSFGPSGRLNVYGRQSEAISRGITLIYPGWLEKPVACHPEVLEVSVVGVPDPINFNNTCACVVKRPESRLTEQQILDIVQDSLTEDGRAFLALDFVIFFEKCLPKLSKKLLGELAAKRLGIMF